MTAGKALMLAHRTREPLLARYKMIRVRQIKETGPDVVMFLLYPTQETFQIVYNSRRFIPGETVKVKLVRVHRGDGALLLYLSAQPQDVVHLGRGSSQGTGQIELHLKTSQRAALSGLLLCPPLHDPSSCRIICGFGHQVGSYANQRVKGGAHLQFLQKGFQLLARLRQVFTLATGGADFLLQTFSPFQPLHSRINLCYVFLCAPVRLVIVWIDFKTYIIAVSIDTGYCCSSATYKWVKTYTIGRGY